MSVFSTGPCAPNAFLQPGASYQCVGAELLLVSPFDAYGPWVIDLWFLRQLPGAVHSTESWSRLFPRSMKLSSLFKGFFFFKFTLPVKYLWLKL